MKKRSRAGGKTRRKTATLKRRSVPKTARRSRYAADQEAKLPNGKHLQRQINDVLNLSKTEGRELTLSLPDYSLAELVQGVYVTLELLAAQKNLALTANIAKDLVISRFDERRLAQVLLDLVGNAIRFSEVAIEASLSDGSFRVFVRDAIGRSGFVLTAKQHAGDHIAGHFRLWRLAS